MLLCIHQVRSMMVQAGASPLREVPLANTLAVGGKSGVPSEAMVENSRSLRWPEGVLQLWAPLAVGVSICNVLGVRLLTTVA